MGEAQESAESSDLLIPASPRITFELLPPFPQREPALSPTPSYPRPPARWGGRVLARKTSDSELFEQELIYFISD